MRKTISPFLVTLVLLASVMPHATHAASHSTSTVMEREGWIVSKTTLGFDALIEKLEAAISELQAAGINQRDASGDLLSPEDVRMAEARFADALARIEARLEEQELSFRHVLTMLIEWLEEDPSREAA